MLLLLVSSCELKVDNSENRKTHKTHSLSFRPCISPIQRSCSETTRTCLCLFCMFKYINSRYMRAFSMFLISVITFSSMRTRACICESPLRCRSLATSKSVHLYMEMLSRSSREGCEFLRELCFARSPAWGRGRKPFLQPFVPLGPSHTDRGRTGAWQCLLRELFHEN